MDDVILTGRYHLVHRSKSGKVLNVREGKNLVVTTGKSLLADIVEDNTPTRPSHMAIGSGTTVVSEADTALTTELQRVALTSGIRVNNELTYKATFTAAGQQTISEAGIFNDPTTGTMLARWLTQTFTMDTGESVTVDWTLTFG